MTAKHPRTFTQTVPASSEASIKLQGRYIACYEADANFEVRLDTGPKFEFWAGAEYPLPEGAPDYKEVVLINPTAGDITVKLALGYGEFRDRRFQASGTLDTEEQLPTGVTGSGDQAIADATTATIAGSASRRELFVQADADNTGPLHLRDGTGNAFARLAPGEGVFLGFTGTVQVRNDSGAAQTYRYGVLA